MLMEPSFKFTGHGIVANFRSSSGSCGSISQAVPSLCIVSRLHFSMEQNASLIRQEAMFPPFEQYIIIS